MKNHLILVAACLCVPPHAQPAGGQLCLEFCPQIRGSCALTRLSVQEALTPSPAPGFVFHQPTHFAPHMPRHALAHMGRAYFAILIHCMSSTCFFARKYLISAEVLIRIFHIQSSLAGKCVKCNSWGGYSVHCVELLPYSTAIIIALCNKSSTAGLFL